MKKLLLLLMGVLMGSMVSARTIDLITTGTDGAKHSVLTIPPGGMLSFNADGSPVVSSTLSALFVSGTAQSTGSNGKIFADAVKSGSALDIRIGVLETLTGSNGTEFMRSTPIEWNGILGTYGIEATGDRHGLIVHTSGTQGAAIVGWSESGGAAVKAWQSEHADSPALSVGRFGAISTGTAPLIFGMQPSDVDANQLSLLGFIVNRSGQLVNPMINGVMSGGTYSGVSTTGTGGAFRSAAFQPASAFATASTVPAVSGSGLGFIDSTAVGMTSGTADCSAAFQAGVNAAANTATQTFLIRTGTYTFASTITVPSNVTVTGEGVADRGGYTPAPNPAWHTKLIYSGTRNALYAPLTCSVAFKNFELMASNTSTAVGAVGAGILISNTTTSGWESYPYFTGNHPVVDSVYVHEFNDNIFLTFCGTFVIRNSNFSSARDYNIRLGTTTLPIAGGSIVMGGGDGIIDACYVGGGTYADGSGQSSKGIYSYATNVKITDTWVYAVVRAFDLDASQITLMGAQVEGMTTGTTMATTANFTTVNAVNCTFRQGTPFETGSSGYWSWDTTGGTGNARLVFLNCSGAIGPIKSLISIGYTATAIPISGGMETLTSGTTVYSSRRIGIPPESMAAGILPAANVLASATGGSNSVNSALYQFNQANTGWYGNSTWIGATVNGRPCGYIYADGHWYIPDSFTAAGMINYGAMRIDGACTISGTCAAASYKAGAATGLSGTYSASTNFVVTGGIITGTAP